MHPVEFDLGHEGPGFFNPDAPPERPATRDMATSSAGPLTTVNAIVGFVPVSFDFFNEGGTSNLLPGRPTTRTVTIPNPRGNPFFVMLRGINAAFVTDGGRNLTQRPLGQIRVSLFVPDVNTVGCAIRLTDENSDDAVRVQVQGWAVLFR